MKNPVTKSINMSHFFKSFTDVGNPPPPAHKRRSFGPALKPNHIERDSQVYDKTQTTVRFTYDRATFFFYTQSII